MEYGSSVRFSSRMAADRSPSAVSGSAPYLPIWC